MYCAVGGVSAGENEYGPLEVMLALLLCRRKKCVKLWRLSLRLPKRLLEIEDDWELMLLSDTTDVAGVGSYVVFVVFVLRAECRALVLSEGVVERDGLDATDARTEGGARAEPYDMVEDRTESVNATEDLRSALESVVAADCRWSCKTCFGCRLWRCLLLIDGKCASTTPTSRASLLSLSSNSSSDVPTCRTSDS